jgi:hypothetical protein
VYGGGEKVPTEVIVGSWSLLLSLFCSWPWSEQCSSAIHFHPDALSHQGPKSNGINWPWTETLKIMSQNKLFLFLSWLSQVFCDSSRRLTQSHCKIIIICMISIQVWVQTRCSSWIQPIDLEHSLYLKSVCFKGCISPFCVPVARYMSLGHI